MTMSLGRAALAVAVAVAWLAGVSCGGGNHASGSGPTGGGGMITDHFSGGSTTSIHGSTTSTGTGTVMCANGLTLCGGACVDTTSDLSNCGACGTVCTTTAPSKVDACTLGRCLIELRSEPGALGALAVDDTNAYYTNTVTSVIEKVPTAGGSFASVTPVSAPGTIAIDTTALFWVENSNSSSAAIKRAQLDGTNPQTLISNMGEVYGLQTDGTYLYWAGFSSLYRVGVDGGQPFVLAQGAGQARFTFDATNVYYTGNASVYQVSIQGADGGAGLALAWNQTGAAGIGVTKTDVYWYAGPSIWKVAIGGGMWMKVGPWATSDVLLSGAYVYGFDSAGLERLSIAGATNYEFMLKPKGSWSALTTDGKSLFWIENDQGVARVMKLTPM
jgi:hypothetical protein